MCIIGNIIPDIKRTISIPRHRGHLSVYRIDYLSRTADLCSLAGGCHMNGCRMLVQYNSGAAFFHRIVMYQNIVEQPVRFHHSTVGVHIIIYNTIDDGERIGDDHRRAVFASRNMKAIQFRPILHNRPGGTVIVRTHDRNPFRLYRKDTFRCILFQQTGTLSQLRFVGSSESAINFHICHPL